MQINLVMSDNEVREVVREHVRDRYLRGRNAQVDISIDDVVTGQDGKPVWHISARDDD